MKRYAKITNEGSKKLLFDRSKTAADTEGAGADKEVSTPIDITIVRFGNHSDGTDMMRAHELMADHDKKPARGHILYG